MGPVQPENRSWHADVKPDPHSKRTPADKTEDEDKSVSRDKDDLFADFDRLDWLEDTGLPGASPNNSVPPTPVERSTNSATADGASTVSSTVPLLTHITTT